MPNCSAVKQRYGQSGCLSTDFYFTPASGAWTATSMYMTRAPTLMEGRNSEFSRVLASTSSPCVYGACQRCDAVDSKWKVAIARTRPIDGQDHALLEKVAPTNFVKLDITDGVRSSRHQPTLAPLPAWRRT